jgi:hypothetical protein
MGVRLSRRTLVTGANARPGPAPAWVGASGQGRSAAPEQVAVAILGGGIAALFASRRKPAA